MNPNWNFNRPPGFIRGHRGGIRGGRGGPRVPWRPPIAWNNFGGPPHRGGFRDFRGGRPQHNFGGRNAQPNQRWKNKPKRDTPGKRLSEEEIGVTEYISDHEGFLGIIKSRYSDFQVSEINEQGEIAMLTDLTPPEASVDAAVDEDEDLLINKYNLEILPMDTWDNINKLAVSEASEERVEVDVSGMTKEQRTKIHDAVKKAFVGSIVGSTVTQDDKKLVRFEKFRKGVRIDNRVKWAWPGEYVYFVVYKENCDTMDAAIRIAERLRLNIKPSMLGYAGTKDRRAKTSQWFSLRKVDPRRIAASCQNLRDILVGNYSFSSNNLCLGMLRGNRFRITLRNVTVADSVVDTACHQLKERGFINYYGLQRFGSRIETPTYEIGLKLLQGNFREAIGRILEEREGVTQHALRTFAESGAAAALRVFPRRAAAAGGAALEYRLLRALADNPNDLLGALSKLARNTRLLYLHSYQSLVWNRCVSERLRRHGLVPAAGDLVPLSDVVHEAELPMEDSDNEDEDTDATQDGAETANKTADEKNEAVELPKNALETSIKQEKQKVLVKVLTEDDVNSGKYDIFDVILPLPGFTVEYPPNLKEYYEELLSKDGLNLEMKHKLKSYSMSGAYRHVVTRPNDVTWRCVRYSDPTADLVLSDRDALENKNRPTGIVQDGKYKALLLTMTLPASCYATMALRELLKVDTSCDNQALQNNYHKKKEVKPETEDTEDKKEENESNGVKEESAKRKIEGESEVELEAKKPKQVDE